MKGILLLKKKNNYELTFQNELKYLKEQINKYLDKKNKYLVEKEELTNLKNEQLQKNSLERKSNISNLIKFNKNSKNNKKIKEKNELEITKIEKEMEDKYEQYDILVQKKRRSYKLF